MISPQAITRKDAGGKSVAAAIDAYYQEEQDDYYTREKQPSEWYGSLSNDLGLQGLGIEKQDFAELLEGKFQGQTLRDSSFKKNNANDRLGMDLTFNAPKSVSIQALVAGDTRLIQAHHEAVKESLAILEGKAQARRKVGGKTRIEETNKIAVAMFRHETNRNLDPHLHTHSVVLNITKRSDGEFRALHNDKLVRGIPEASQAYQTNLAKKCKELGYDIRINDNGTFDLAHISREQIMQFSTRSRQVEAALAEKGLTRETATKEQKQVATLETRERKKTIDKEFVKSVWAETAKKLGLSKILSPRQAIKEQEHDRTNDQSIESNRQRERGRKHTISRGAASESNHEQSQQLQPTNERDPTNTREETNAQTNSLHDMPSSNVADTAQRREMLLPNNEQLELHEPRTDRDSQMRWRSNGISSIKSIVDKFKIKLGLAQQPIQTLEKTPSLESTRNLEDTAKFETLTSQNRQERETLKDMIAYEPPTDDLTEEWQTLASEVRLNLTPGQVFDEANKEFSGDRLMSHVIEHLVDKKVDLVEEEIIKETLTKGMGEVSYNDAQILLKNFIEKGELVKAEPLYKTSEDKNNNTAKTIEQWQKYIIENSKNNIQPEAAAAAIKEGIEQGRLIPLTERFVTKKDLKIEKEILQIMENGKGSKKAFYSESEADKLLEESTLNTGQKSAAKLIMTTEDRVVGIQGYAGVGKSYTLSETLNHVTAAGGTAHVFAPYGSQVKSLKEDGHNAHTLAKLLSSKTLQDEITENSVIVVDEAGVIANNDANRLLKLAEAKNAKVVLLGDTQQTKAINAGKPFDVLQANGMAMATIDEIQRQKEETLKKAVFEAAMNQPKESVKTLEKSIYEITDRQERLDTLVDAYIKLEPEEREKTLIVTGTNDDKDYINKTIREELGIAGKGIETSQLKRVDMSKAEMKHARYYQEGNFIETQTNPVNQSLQKDQIYEIVGKDKSLLIVKDNQGNEIKFEPGKEKLSVYKSEQVEISKNDRLRVTKGNSELGTVTGDKLIVEEVNKHFISARDEKSNELHTFSTKEKNHLDHDYCSTVHSSQGLTVDRVLINIDTKSRTTGKEVYYVAVSRAKHEAMVVTDDINRLPNAIAKGAEKHSAYEMVGVEHKGIAIETNQQNELQQQRQYQNQGMEI